MWYMGDPLQPFVLMNMVILVYQLLIKLCRTGMSFWLRSEIVWSRLSSITKQFMIGAIARWCFHQVSGFGSVLHRPAASLNVRGRGKLGPRFFGPFQVLDRIGEVTYKLALPARSRIHDVFHVGLLKPFHGTPPAEIPPLPPLQHGRVMPEPESVIRSRLARGQRELLMRWKGAPTTDASWVLLEEFQQHFPKFQLEDELPLQGGEMSWSDSRTRGGARQQTGTSKR